MTQTIVRTKTGPVLGWWLDLGLVAGFVALTVALSSGYLLTPDRWVADWVVTHQPEPAYWTARALNYLGQGGQVLIPASLILTGLLAYRTRSVRAVLPFAAAFLLISITVLPLKIWADRAAPRFSGPDRTVMFNPHASGRDAMSYPSGHVTNTLLWYTVLALLIAALLRRPLRRWENWTVRVLPVVIVFWATIYLGFHWVTDSIAGVFLGLVLARLIERVRWDELPLPRLRGWAGPAFTPRRPPASPA